MPPLVHPYVQSCGDFNQTLSHYFSSPQRLKILLETSAFVKNPCKPTSEMDPINSEMKNSTKRRFLNKLLLHSVSALFCTLFCSFPFWFPLLCSSLKQFTSVSLPNFISLFFSPKFLFVLGNAIVVFLVGQSKLSSSRESIKNKIEDDNEYMVIEKEKEEEQQQQQKVRDVDDEDDDDGGDDDDDDEEEEEEEYGDCNDGDEEEEREERKEEKVEEEVGLPTEEFNKRVEDFIARVNRQRRLEARLLDRERG